MINKAKEPSRILVVSDATNAISGYSKVARNLLEALTSAGFITAQLGWYHQYRPSLRAPWSTFTTYKDHSKCCGRGSVVCEWYSENKMRYVKLDKEGKPVSADQNKGYCPKGKRIDRDRYGHLSTNLVMVLFKPDIVISIGDQWMCQPANDSQFRHKYKHIMYAAVDGKPLPRFTSQPGHHMDWYQLYKTCDHAVTYCDWAKDTVNAMVGEDLVSEVIPFGVNPETFRALPPNVRSYLRTHLHQFLHIGRTRGSVIWDKEPQATDNTFNAIYVGRHIQRKNIPFIIQTVARFKEQGYERPERPVRLILHMPYEDNGWNLDELIRQYDAYDWVMINPYIKPSHGPESTELNEIYNLADVHLHMSAAEGWALTLLESLSAGVITTAMDYSAPSSWGHTALQMIKPAVIRQEPMTNLGRAYPDVDHAVSVLNHVYTMDEGERNEIVKQGRELAESLSWTRFKEHWVDFVNRVVNE